MNSYNIKVMNYKNTNSVQFFIRTVVWVISFLLLTIISKTLFETFNSFWLFGFPLTVLNFFISSALAKMFFILPEWENLVLLQLGKFHSVKEAGFFIIPPFICSVAAIVDKRIETHQVEATNTLTKDNVPIKVTAAVEFRVEDPKKAIIDVLNYRESVIWLATEALKNTIGSLDLRGLLSEREHIATSLKEQIDNGAVAYGVDVRAVRITDIDTPQTLIEELAVIARSKRAAKAKQIQAEAEVLVAQKISEATEILSKQEGSLKLRELQMLSDVSKEESSMIIIYPYGEKGGQSIASAAAGSRKNAIKKEDNK